MRPAFSITVAIVLAAMALGGCAPVSPAADSAKKPATASEAGRNLGKTGKAVKDYTVEQRDAALKSAKSALDDLDAQISRFASAIESKWDRMDAATRKQSRETLNALRRERTEAAEWYGALKHSSKEAWEDVKGGFVKSYEALKESLAKAKDKF